MLSINNLTHSPSVTLQNQNLEMDSKHTGPQLHVSKHFLGASDRRRWIRPTREFFMGASGNFDWWRHITPNILGKLTKPCHFSDYLMCNGMLRFFRICHTQTFISMNRHVFWQVQTLIGHAQLMIVLASLTNLPRRLDTKTCCTCIILCMLRCLCYHPTQNKHTAITMSALHTA